MKLVITDIEGFDIPVEGEYELVSPKGEIHGCVGCFGCWTRTPGECVIKDGYERVGSMIGHADELILVSRCCFGSVSPFVKTCQDRGLSFIHPDFRIVGGEMHHKQRYQNRLTMSAHLYGEDITEAEKDTARRLIQANADNYAAEVKGVSFYGSADELRGVTL